ncbi:hypothetical protein BO82DRAFT_336518 [Aspergillus uvarum CBS 121591]|uniref:Uncharacterized protein n=1 Tax=Aspergillus uvarum CBS 121591 TaxID=1448315 RepID=A0A319CB69_9EURO|nr:hypothetical protein BO82DRAFT_336518 [Aspergillus uvarum CBS 121591]PYH81359.1 hypothetical protein BO82DRAFT_336518 [Aspergillus uvarum CBS 121591]
MCEPQERDKEPFSPDIVADSRSSHLANPGPLGFGAFATTLMTLSFSVMGFRSVSNQTVFIANLCFLAGIGLLISAQWEMMKGNTFAYTVLGAFASYYGGYGVLLMPPLGIVDSYGGETTEYYNAFGLYLSVMFASQVWVERPSERRQHTIYGALELSYIFNCTANFMMADGHSALGDTFTTIAGAFGMVSALAVFYKLGHDLCQDALPCEIPLIPTSRVLFNS